ncbi:leucine-rich repeat receptor-like protein kinase PXC2 [Melia azedarach]|uniref:Leucine-rich repeat receptor-like protein kinase PXC2 n=1 Tax=Melia azedarach TaxID=155640 RepID=A0ACC1XQQ8_MELAZ|nr:leucine-rich repeat receptor-like protein kinase PXC2 [Melia azedarach]
MSFSFPLRLLSLLFLSLSLSHFKFASAACHVDDESGLLGFKSGITQDPSAMLSSWKPGTECCSWAGVTCLANNRVTSLSLLGQHEKPNSFLAGVISPSLARVKHLDGIYLQNLGNISGTFPDFIFGLPHLKYVYIENNKLSGQLPANIGKLTQLEALSVAGNRFTGPIPSSVSELTQLTQLNLGQNLLTGTVPDNIRQLKNLTYLNLQHNQLSGALPDIFSSFKNLVILRLSYNKFSGTIPSSIASLAPNLQYLELGHNVLTGKIPDFLGKFQALDTLDLSWNRLSGTVPKSFSNLTKIFNLNLSHNSLIDPFPVMNVKGIESLDLSYNQFHLQQIPNWVTSSPIIFSLKLAKCGIKMNLNYWKPAETYFYDYIDLSDNEISGSPVWLLNRTDYLVEFRASRNKLKFNMESLRLVETLKVLDLSRNLVFGKLPKGISGLAELNVSYNNLCGQIPASKFPASAFLGNACLCGSPLPSTSCKCFCGK